MKCRNILSMTNEPIWGSNILRILKEIGSDGNVVAVIRHSERPNFDALPPDKWENVGLTEKGTKEAIIFGQNLVNVHTKKSYKILAWGLKRCIDTAEAISKGAQNQGCDINGPSKVNLQSPVANNEAYYNALFSGKWDYWNKMIDDWLNDDATQSIMVPARRYARHIYKSLLAEEFNSSEKITLIVTHDLHILPLARLIFPSASRLIDYLNGVVLKIKDNECHIGFEREFLAVNRKDILDNENETLNSH